MVNRDANGRFATKPVQSQQVTSPSQTQRVTPNHHNQPCGVYRSSVGRSQTSHGIPYQLTDQQNKVCILNYSPILARVSGGGKITDIWGDSQETQSYQHFLNKALIVKECILGTAVNTVVDLKTINPEIWNSELDDWTEIPVVTDILTQLYYNRHPLLKNYVADGRTIYCCMTGNCFNNLKDYLLSYTPEQIQNLYTIKDEELKTIFTGITVEKQSDKNAITHNDLFSSNGCAFRLCTTSTKDSVKSKKYPYLESFLDRRAVWNKLYDYYAGFNFRDLFTIIDRNLSNTHIKVYSGVDLLTVPKFEDEEVIEHINKSLNFDTTRYATSPSTTLELEDNSEMLEKLKGHLSMLPGVEIKYLRKRLVAYTCSVSHPHNISGANYCHHLHRSKKDYHLPENWGIKEFPNSQYVRDLGGVLYWGEAWSTYFTIDGKDVLGGNLIYFITPDQYHEAYKKTRYIYEQDGKTPIDWKGNDIIYLCNNNWCERQDGHFSDDTADFQTPYQRRLPLWGWIMSSLIHKKGIKLKGVEYAQIDLSAKKKALNDWRTSHDAAIAEIMRDVTTTNPETIQAIIDNPSAEVEDVIDVVLPEGVTHQVIDVSRFVITEPVQEAVNDQRLSDTADATLDPFYDEDNEDEEGEEYSVLLFENEEE